MSVKGSSIRWLNAAIERGDAAAAFSAAAEMRRGTLNLDHALAVVVLLAGADSPRVEAAAQRWVTRWTEERGDPAKRGQRERWLTLLEGLPDLEAVTTLDVICERLGYEHATRALEHLYPRVR